jgi:hypothetical protein
VVTFKNISWWSTVIDARGSTVAVTWIRAMPGPGAVRSAMAVSGPAACARESNAITVETSLRDAMSHSFRQRHAPHMPPPRQHADKQNTEQNDWPLHHMQNKYRINLLLSDINYMYSLKKHR